MTSNFNPILLIIYLFTFGAITGIGFLIRVIISSKKIGSKSIPLHFSASVLCVLIAITSWILNFGWFRLVLTFTAVPLVHSAFFIAIIIFACSYADRSHKLKKIIIWSYVTYLLTYLILPDGGDYGSMYIFFGLIHNDTIGSICYFLSLIALICNIILLILMIIETIKLKTSKKDT